MLLIHGNFYNQILKTISKIIFIFLNFFLQYLFYIFLFFFSGPDARSCHKIAFDSKMKRIYTIGRYLDYDEKGGQDQFNSDFYYYCLKEEKWYLISNNTAVC